MSDYAYTTLDIMKSRLSITSTKDDDLITDAIETAEESVNDHCGTRFDQVTEARTFSYNSIYEIFTDEFVPGSITAFSLDYDGDGVYEVEWTEGRDYQTLRYAEEYNPRRKGLDQPHDFIRVLLSEGNPIPAGGEMLPFVWAYTPNNRVQIAATWGWASVPKSVSMATQLLAAQLYKLKDAPWGMIEGEFGTAQIKNMPQVARLLRPYRDPRGTVGV